MLDTAITKSAVVCVILSDRGRTLMVSRPENPDHFGIPGGKLEEGESAVQACVREVYEEAGIRLNGDDLYRLMYRVVPSRREPNTIYRTYCYVNTTPIRELDYKSSEGLILKWVEPWQIVQPPYAYYNALVYTNLCDGGFVKRQ